MADFCMQCNVDMGFGPYSDFDHLPKGTKFIELCEGCGPILVEGGECVDPRCRMHREPAERARRAYEDARGHTRTRRGPMGLLWRLRDRLLGTPWCPGLIHDWRLRWNLWRQGDGTDEIEWDGKWVLPPDYTQSYDSPDGMLVFLTTPDGLDHPTPFELAWQKHMEELKTDVQNKTTGAYPPRKDGDIVEVAEFSSDQDERPVQGGAPGSEDQPSGPRTD